MRSLEMSRTSLYPTHIIYCSNICNEAFMNDMFDAYGTETEASLYNLVVAATAKA